MSFSFWRRALVPVDRDTHRVHLLLGGSLLTRQRPLRTRRRFTVPVTPGWRDAFQAGIIPVITRCRVPITLRSACRSIRAPPLFELGRTCVTGGVLKRSHASAA